MDVSPHAWILLPRWTKSAQNSSCIYSVWYKHAWMNVKVWALHMAWRCTTVGSFLTSWMHRRYKNSVHMMQIQTYIHTYHNMNTCVFTWMMRTWMHVYVCVCVRVCVRIIHIHECVCMYAWHKATWMKMLVASNSHQLQQGCKYDRQNEVYKGSRSICKKDWDHMHEYPGAERQFIGNDLN
jgi:hypothetical protein